MKDGFFAWGLMVVIGIGSVSESRNVARSVLMSWTTCVMRCWHMAFVMHKATHITEQKIGHTWARSVSLSPIDMPSMHLCANT